LICSPWDQSRRSWRWWAETDAIGTAIAAAEIAATAITRLRMS
jgi:hypothetical protein